MPVEARHRGYLAVAIRALALICLLASSSSASGQVGNASPTDAVRYAATPLRVVMSDIESLTGFRFLYRDALVAGVSVTMSAEPNDLMPTFVRTLAEAGITASIDSARNQVLLAPTPPRTVKLQKTISGVVVDAASGNPLPYATVAWRVAGNLSGVVADGTGRFSIPGAVSNTDSTFVQFSYVGYNRLTVRRADLFSGFAARLTASSDLVSEVIVSAIPLRAEVDSVWSRILTSGDMPLLGESNSIRALQALPAVSISGAISGGTVVRGSRADGFQVLLDGVRVYSASHLFGLFDAFNADALRAVGLFYGVSPAEYAGPPGGTVSFLTRGGSHVAPAQKLTLSSTGVSGTVEGPLFGGLGSWLLSGRRSLLDVVDWFGNGELISLGLDVGRETSAPPAVQSLNDRVLRPGDRTASFFDMHGKVVLDSRGSGRWVANAYVGGDDTGQEARRFVVTARDSMQRVVLRDVATTNSWHNEIVSLRREGGLRSGGRYAFDAFSSTYGSDYQKDDFAFIRRPVANPVLAQTVFDTLQSGNKLFDQGASVQFDGVISPTTTATAGARLHLLRTDYSELAAGLDREFDGRLTAQQLDVFASSDMRLGRIEPSIGLRAHMYSADSRLRLSPRIRAEAIVRDWLILFAGYARSHQFLHQLSLDTEADARIWTLSTKSEPPGVADQVSTGLRATAGQIALQVEAYYKRSSGIRQHQTVVARRQVLTEGFVLSPWLHDVEGRSSGIEFMLRSSTAVGLFSASYAAARSELRHPRIDRATWYPSDWDRRHQVTALYQRRLFAGVSVVLQWQFGSGSPNDLAALFPAEPDRLPSYHRLDLSVNTTFNVGSVRIAASASAYNLYDRENVWYRTTLGVLEGPLNDLEIRTTNVDVYDLGIRPSFSVSVASR